MASLAEFFEHLRKNKDDYLNASSGEAFEQRIYSEMQVRVGMLQIQKDQFTRNEFREIKSDVLRRTSTVSARNSTGFRKHLIYQPCGTQQYPDAIIFDGDKLHVVETKFSKNVRAAPFWNSGPPRPTGIYIFGAYKLRDLTFFMGRGILSPEEASEMHGELDRIQAEAERWNDAHAHRQRYGFRIYARRAFDQRKKSNPDAIVDFFTNPYREALEDEVIAYLRETSST